MRILAFTKHVMSFRHKKCIMAQTNLLKKLANHDLHLGGVKRLSKTDVMGFFTSMVAVIEQWTLTSVLHIEQLTGLSQEDTLLMWYSFWT